MQRQTLLEFGPFKDFSSMLTSQDDTKATGTDVHESWMEDGSQPRTDTINFWGRSRSLLPIIFIHFSGSNGWILMRKSGILSWLVSIGDTI